MGDPSIDLPADQNPEAPLQAEAATTPPMSAEPPITDDEIQRYQEEYETQQRELADLRARASSADPAAIARAVAEAVKPPQPKLWENVDEWMKDRASFAKGLEALVEHRLSGALDRLNRVEQAVPFIYARSAENPNYPGIEKLAVELMKNGMPYQNAVQYATANFRPAATPTAHVPPPVPASAKLPNAASGPKGAPKFQGNIRKFMRELKASGEY